MIGVILLVVAVAIAITITWALIKLAIMIIEEIEKGDDGVRV